MTHTFLLSVNTGSDTDLFAIADELRDALDGSMYDVLDVKPWSQHGEASFSPPASMQPPQTLT